MLKALIFDFDGVIIDTETEWYHIYRDWLKSVHNYDLKISDYLICVGSNSEHLFNFVNDALKKDTGIREFEKEAMNQFIERTNKLSLMPGVKELIKTAKQNGIKLAIATSATRKKPETQLKRLGLFEYFDVLSTAELSENIKPAPDIFLKAIELLGCKSEECLAIEDSHNGLLSAINARIPCLIVPNKITEHSDFEGCYKKVKSLKEIDLIQLMKDF